jgi:hypothetical protein
VSIKNTEQLRAIQILPDKFGAFGEDCGDNFFLVTNSPYVNHINIGSSEKYKNTSVLTCDPGEDFIEKIIKNTPEGSCLMTIMPDCLVYSVPADILGGRKLLIMACRSGHTNLLGIQHFISSVSEQDIADQEGLAEKFFSKGEISDYLEIVNPTFGTSCRFDHLNEDYEWHEQYGLVQWGEQQVFPSGEIACFLVPLYIENLSEETNFELNGEIVTQGPVIVQSGSPSFQIVDQLRIHEALQTEFNSGVKLTVENGVIIAHEPVNSEGKAASDMLNALFLTDSRYRRIYEVGFSINESVDLWPGNTAMNEVWGGKGGRIHIGLGMLPHTQYHIDMFCSKSNVETDTGEVILGYKDGTMRRKKSAACPCIEL